MNEIERKKRYRQHRLRIQNATSLVNSQPASVNDSREQRKLTFIEMMTALYQKGNSRTFTQSPTTVVRHVKSCCPFTKEEVKRQLSSHDLFASSLSLDHASKRKQHVERVSKKELKSIPPSNGIPYHVWQRYRDLPFIKSPRMLMKLLRPQIFLDLHLSNGQPLGRLVIQLFTEACPEIVLQFVRICMSQQAERFKFTRILLHLWLEGELHLMDKNALTIPNIEHDPMAINHGSAAGILSFPSRYLRGSKFRFISFTVSFKPIDVLNGKRIAFGKIRRGQHVLQRLQQNCEVSDNGKPLKEIYVTTCGVL
ncbi:peptidyl-prolyl cis-trans isomerase A [Musca autumnalis]|uniref:peptidyl-prolyl cis-trans isomerase A n=1 Tax=Musca autumnalis TaxID=221902 RepID=UPI003CED2502